jgi:hypothetical protein
MLAEPAATQSNRRWLWMTFLILLAGLLFAQIVEKDFRDRLISYVRMVLQKVDQNSAGIPASLPEKAKIPHDQDSAVRKNHDSVANPVIRVPSRGVIQRDSTG